MKSKQKQLKNKEKKQVKTLERLKPEETKEEEETKSVDWRFSKGMRKDEIKNEIDEIKNWKNKIKRKDFKIWNK